MKLNTAQQNSQVSNLATNLATASLIIYAGSVPATANAAAGTVLVTHTLAGFGSASSGSVTANAVANATIAATGTASYARITNGTNTVQLTLGLSGSGAECIVSGLSYVSGETSQVVSIVLSQPAG